MDRNKIRLTNQRLEILDFLKNNKSHPTVEQIYEEVRKKLPRISRATVYQNLRILADNKMIQEVNIRGVSRFETNPAPHHHIICKNCGKITDFYSRDLTDYTLKIADKIREMNIETASTSFYGKCKKCRA